ncbi:unnamed protein product [Amoebophrya sp. A120]|nr:unnamed protein product [Amoebophrya sp. A120]|eukprot:GSA120T00022911001.1
MSTPHQASAQHEGSETARRGASVVHAVTSRTTEASTATSEEQQTAVLARGRTTGTRTSAAIGSLFRRLLPSTTTIRRRSSSMFSYSRGSRSSTRGRRGFEQQSAGTVEGAQPQPPPPPPPPAELQQEVQRTQQQQASASSSSSSTMHHQTRGLGAAPRLQQPFLNAALANSTPFGGRAGGPSSSSSGSRNNTGQAAPPPSRGGSSGVQLPNQLQTVQQASSSSSRARNVASTGVTGVPSQQQLPSDDMAEVSASSTAREDSTSDTNSARQIPPDPAAIVRERDAVARQRLRSLPETPRDHRDQNLPRPNPIIQPFSLLPGSTTTTGAAAGASSSSSSSAARPPFDPAIPRIQYDYPRNTTGSSNRLFADDANNANANTFTELFDQAARNVSQFVQSVLSPAPTGRDLMYSSSSSSSKNAGGFMAGSKAPAMSSELVDPDEPPPPWPEPSQEELDTLSWKERCAISEARAAALQRRYDWLEGKKHNTDEILLRQQHMFRRMSALDQHEYQQQIEALKKIKEELFAQNQAVEQQKSELQVSNMLYQSTIIMYDNHMVILMLCYSSLLYSVSERLYHACQIKFCLGGKNFQHDKFSGNSLLRSDVQCVSGQAQLSK